MAYILAAAIIALLVVGFTRKTIVVLALLVGLIFLSVGAYLLWDDHRQRLVADRNRDLITTIAYDPACATGRPIRISLRNTGEHTLLDVRFDVAGYREGHSVPLYRTRDYFSDRILQPGEDWVECWQLPQPIRGTDLSPLRESPPATLRWEIENKAGTFDQ